MSLSWLFVVIAGFLEVIWAMGLKASQGFSKPIISVFTVITMIGSFILLSLGMKNLPMATAYAVWTGVGVAGTALIGMMFLGEAVTLLRLGSLFLIALGMIGLRLQAE